MAAPPSALTQEEKDHFLTHGYVRLRNCFTREQAETLIGNVWIRLGMDPADQSTWTNLRTNMPSHRDFKTADFAPRAWAAVCELLGGEDRIGTKGAHWRDSLIVNLGSPEHEGRETRPQDLNGWHVDGDFFVHYLDSPEQALLVTPLFTDVVPGGGGTVICPEAIPKIAKHLYEHPEGVSPRMDPRGSPTFAEDALPLFCNDLAKTCSNFIEVTGDCGDVYLMHPLMLHSATLNPLRKVRIITNPPVNIKEPFNFNREDGKYSLVEQKTLAALGRESLPDWAIQGPRENRTPNRWKAVEKMKEEELKRLEQAKAKQATQVSATA